MEDKKIARKRHGVGEDRGRVTRVSMENGRFS